MAYRVETDDVKRIIETELVDLSMFISVANVQVDAIATLGTLDAATLKEIEKWLAAHYVSLRDRQPTKITMGDTSHTYGGKTGMGLSYSRYGQMALVLDSTGTLASSGRRKASATYLGGTVSSTGEVKV